MTVLTPKEKMVISEEKSHEELCIIKYEKALEEACDLELKKLFSSILEHEKEHLKTLNRMLSGDIPDIEKESKEKQKDEDSKTTPPVDSDDENSGTTFNGVQLNMFQNEMKLKIGMEACSDLSPDEQCVMDTVLCQDALVSEKFVSSTYNNSIFDCVNKDIRKVLNHIQKDEQEHGEQILDYMLAHGYCDVE